MIGSLAGEQVRWTESVAKITKDMKNTLAFSLFGAASIIYAGAFNSEFRQRLYK